MYKRFFSILIFCATVFLTSCWIYPDYKDYEVIDKVYFFNDYETMKSVIIPMINKSYSAWHWDDDEFDKKYDKYFGNIEANSEDLTSLSEYDYEFAVRNERSSSKVSTKNGSVIAGEYFWITSRRDGAVVFYQN